MISLQKQIDQNPSPNTPELNNLINGELVPLLESLSKGLEGVLGKKDGEIAKCQDSIQKLLQKHVGVSANLSTIEAAEKRRIKGLQGDFKGHLRKVVVEGLGSLQDSIASIAHSLVQTEIDSKVAELRGLNTNPVLLKHIILWQMRLFLNPELAFKA